MLSEHHFSRGIALLAALVVLVGSLFASSALAQAQRMLILPTTGSITIGGGGSGSVPALCLDANRASPESSDVFSAAPASAGSISVRVGSETMPLQAALDRKLMSITGDGGHHSVDFNNLTDSEISITVPTTSAVAPSDYSDVSDLEGLPWVGATTEELAALANGAISEQVALWDAREPMEFAREAGLPAGLARSLGPDGVGALLSAAIWFDDATYEYDTSSEPKVAPPVPIVRIEHEGMQHYLLLDRYEPRYVAGNQNLRRLSEHAEEISASFGTPVSYVLFGQGNESDFDAVKLTLSTSAGGNGIIVPTTFALAPPGFPPGPPDWSIHGGSCPRSRPSFVSRASLSERYPSWIVAL